MRSYSAELHCHTNHSDGSFTPAQLIRRAKKIGIDIVAITDHNTAEGALPFWYEQPEGGPLVIPGEEISTDNGHILAYFVKETIQPGTFEDVITEIRSQDALPFLAHPVKIPLLGNIRGKKDRIPGQNVISEVVGIEVVNGHSRRVENDASKILWKNDEELVGISGSDAHFLFELGNTTTQIIADGLTLESIRESMCLRQRLRYKEVNYSAYPIYLFKGIVNILKNMKY